VGQTGAEGGATVVCREWHVRSQYHASSTGGDRRARERLGCSRTASRALQCGRDDNLGKKTKTGQTTVWPRGSRA